MEKETILTDDNLKSEYESLPEEMKKALEEFDNLEIESADEYDEVGALAIPTEVKTKDDEISNASGKILEKYARKEFSETEVNNLDIDMKNLFKKQFKEYDYKGITLIHGNFYEFEIHYDLKDL